MRKVKLFHHSVRFSSFCECVYLQSAIYQTQKFALFINLWSEMFISILHACICRSSNFKNKLLINMQPKKTRKSNRKFNENRNKKNLKCRCCYQLKVKM